MRVPGAPPRPPRVVIRDLVETIKELEELAAVDSDFALFFYDPKRCPLRVLGLKDVPEVPARKLLDAWDGRSR